MTAHYVEIDTASFEEFLMKHGFSRSRFNNEVVYEKAFDAKNPNLKIKVFTSGSVGEQTAREVGQDAIRVVAIFEKGERFYPIFKGKRVHRTTSLESVCERTLERIAAANARCEEWLVDQAARFPPPVQIRSQHIGTVGEELRLDVVVVERRPWQDKFLFTMKDDKGNIYTYWTFRDSFQHNEKYSLRATVRAHTIFRGVHQTEVTKVFGKRVIV